MTNDDPNTFIPSSSIPSNLPSSIIGAQMIRVQCDLFDQAWRAGELVDGVSLKDGFSEEEIEYCMSRARPNESLAARYAAKRAASALSKELWSAFVITRTQDGVPSLHGPSGPWLVSLSHDGRWAIAYVVQH